MHWFRSWMGTILLLVLAVAMGLVAVWAVQKYLQEQQASIRAAHQVVTASRVVVGQAMQAGMRLQADHLAVRDFPLDLLPSESVSPDDYSQVVGLRLRRSLQAGDLLLPAYLHEHDDIAFSQQLLPGRRAMTIPVDDINSVSGLIQSGDLIDIYVSFDEQDRRVTAPLLQSVLVRATGKQISPEKEFEASQNYRTLTLDLAPDEALRLVAARQNGRITALLRNPGDHEHSQKAMRGELAHVLGIGATQSETTIRKPEILYGHMPQASQASGAAVPLSALDNLGLIDLPFSAAREPSKPLVSEGGIYE
ncbi:Flp pilus assembly protein CpaB [Alcaligenes endophyticus]|uniref:Flp pilus assembly protein CpaB n=1 Tax=Alcaligenes endophyticus TaxID=1929088 RepID=A0ABT8EK73_9BURK|nr:Flp pilus assembly protein CpaB [Alcaligenes endophyticus]MCX5592003.1 Flp pilus assembly protein CpaB [Alcaligenes endophyticus]MDN4121693.1 Flp pilus assembly protein CpaB [Alcaligenes endophyticus]